MRCIVEPRVAVMFRTYGNLCLKDDGKAWVMSCIEPHVAIRLKQLFPRIAKSQTDNFIFANDENILHGSVCVIL